LNWRGSNRILFIFNVRSIEVKKFLFGILLYATLSSVILIAALGGVYSIISSSSFKIPEEKNIIVVGDSHTQCAINDSIFSRSINISQGGTAYLYSYIKLRKFLNENPHIDTVLVSFHGGSIQRSQDEWIFGDKYILSIVPNYFSLFEMSLRAAKLRGILSVALVQAEARS
jgi:hypothetical protein